MSATPLPLALNDANFLNRLRLAATDSAKIVIVAHAKQRMVERKINRSQVIACLQKGTISEPAHLTPYGDWKATVSHRTAGDNVSVAVAIKAKSDGDYCIVVTVMK